jgi:succinoglycan biosynthesis protein ExoA
MGVTDRWPAPEPEVAAAPARTDLVTVVIPARNEERAIGPCLESVLAQDYPNLQVIVVDGASRDGTADVVGRFAARDGRVELVSNPDAIIPVSLNLALGAARGRWLVRVDAHAAIPPGYVRRAVGHLATGRWGGVGGRKDGMGSSAAGRAVAAAMGSKFGAGPSTYHHGTSERTVEHIPFGAYPTELVRALGGWDEGLVVNQDFEFDYRVRQAGHELLFDPELSIAWQSRQTIRELFSQYRRYGRGKTVVLRKHPGSLGLRHLLPPALVAWLAGAAVVGVRRPGLAAAALAPYAAALAAATALTARSVPDRGARLRLPAAFAAMHVGWGVGFWEGFLQPASKSGRTKRMAR